ncbi:MAG: hypothetical protein ACLTER_23415 [Ruminococcus sp.]
MAQSMGIAGLILGCLIGGLAGSVVMALIYRYSSIPMIGSIVRNCNDL